APRLLLLDEPTTGLDPRSRIELWDAIRALVEAGTDVLLTTQYLDEADHLANPIVIVDHRPTLPTRTPPPLKRRTGRTVITGHARPGGGGGRGRPPRGGPQMDGGPRRVPVGVATAGDGLMAAMRSLEAAGVEIDDIALRQPTLDEVFLALTGQSIGTDEPNRA